MRADSHRERVSVIQKNVLPSNPGIPLNELDKLFYGWELLGARPFSRILFELEGGRIDIGLLRQAFALELKRRPELNAVIVENPSAPGWDVRWMPADSNNEISAVRLCDFSDMSSEAAEEKIREIQFDPFTSYSSRKNPPFSLVLCLVPDGQQKLLAFAHHALTDAHGLGLIFKELFTLYSQVAAGLVPDEPACPDPALPPSALLPESRLKRCMLVLGALAFFARQCIQSRFQTSAKMFSGSNSMSDGMAAVMRAVPAARLSGYLASAKRHGITLNVFLVAAQILAIDRWKQARGEATDVINVDVHQNLRMAKSEQLELSNKFSIFIISTLPRHRSRPENLLQHVRREQDKAQRRATAKKTISLLWLLDSRMVIKTLLKWGGSIFNNPGMGESSQVTNVGRLWSGSDGSARITHLGDAEIAACYMAALPSPAIGNYSSFVTYNNRMYISFNYFTRTMTDEEAQRFMDLFEKTLEDLAASAAASSRSV